jgi:hypothetical protein
MVAGTVSLMRPMVDSMLSAFCNHRMAVNRAFARKAGLSFSTLSFNKSKFHLFFLSMANASYQLLVSNGQLRDAGQTASAFCWFLLLVSVDRWLLMAAVASPYAFSASTHINHVWRVPGVAA